MNKRKPRLPIELVKDLLIVLLTVSAVRLAAQPALFGQVRDWVAPPASEPPFVIQPNENGVIPWCVLVRNSLGLYGAGYDDALVEQAFRSFSPLLGEALSTAGQSRPVSDAQWRDMLENPGVSFAFQGKPPLTVLAAWLGNGENPNLTDETDTVLLSWDGGSTVWLAWETDGAYRRAATALTYASGLSGVLETYAPNGAAYAYALAEQDAAYAALAPYVPVLASTPAPRRYAVYSPDFVNDAEELDSLRESLGFHSGVGSDYALAGELALNAGGDRLRVASDGTVTFRGGEEIRYPVPSVGALPTVSEAADAAWDLLNQTATPWTGEDARFILTGAETLDDGWRITFQTRLDGIPVRAGNRGFTAAFTVRGNAVTDFSVTLTRYTPDGEETLLPSPRLAAAAVKSLNGNGQLFLRYSAAVSGAVEACWMTEHA